MKHVIPPPGYYLGGDYISVKQIQAAVAEAFGIPAIEMVSDRRGRKVARPRQVAMYLARQLTPYSLPSIGHMFGDRDHTTIMHGIAKVAELMEQDHNFKDEVTTLEQQLVPSSEALAVDKSLQALVGGETAGS